MDLPTDFGQEPDHQTLTYRLRRVAANLERLVLEDRSPTPPEGVSSSSLSLTGVSPVELDPVGIHLLDAYQTDDDNMLTSPITPRQLPTLHPSTLMELAQLGKKSPNSFSFPTNQSCVHQTK